MDTDGGLHPQWDETFSFSFKPPKVNSCKVLSTEIANIRIDNVKKYVIVMVREGKLPAGEYLKLSFDAPYYRYDDYEYLGCMFFSMELSPIYLLISLKLLPFYLPFEKIHLHLKCKERNLQFSTNNLRHFNVGFSSFNYF